MHVAQATTKIQPSAVSLDSSMLEMFYLSVVIGTSAPYGMSDYDKHHFLHM